jgi:hypothetical protein
MDRWIKFVALSLLVFTLYDVSVPENCFIEGLAIAGSSSRVQASHQDENRSSGSCQFEEDCTACAHVLPGTHYVFAVTEVVAFAESNLFVSAQGGVPALPYHPPRA